MEYLISNKNKRILVTNDTRDFMENKPGKLYVYGAGLCGYWVGYFLDRCGISYEGYIDRSWQAGSYKYNGKDIFPLEVLKNAEEPVRVIISPKAYVSVLQDILFAFGKMDCVCLLPVYKKDKLAKHLFDINVLLGYFRKKILKGEIPTIISNDCTAGIMYRYLNLPILSPTINVSFTPRNFIKLCMNPKKYLSTPIDDYCHERLYLNAVPDEMGIGFKINDISGHIGRIRSYDEGIQIWNTAIEIINWNRIICVFNENPHVISYNELQEFKRIEWKKLLILNKSPYIEGLEGSIIHVPLSPFFQPDVPVERDFDFLGWLNV